jgi:hypothetical protein
MVYLKYFVKMQKFVSAYTLKSGKKYFDDDNFKTVLDAEISF